MSKTPFEIRLEVLAMAKEMAIEDYYANQEKLIREWDRDTENARHSGSPRPNAPQLPNFPSETDIVKKAQFLSEYIDGNGKNKNTPSLLQE